MTKQVIYVRSECCSLSIYQAKGHQPMLICSDYNKVVNSMCEDLHSPYTHIVNDVLTLVPLMQATGLFSKVIKEAKSLGLL